jgi:mannose-6-phosphate isomerase-like protein (cupin superfamily)
MSKKFVNLFTEPSNITDVMEGPWNDIRVEKVGAGDNLELESDSVEHACFVISGSGKLVNGDGAVFPIQAQGAFAIPAGGRVRLEAADELMVLHVVMDLPA